MKCCPYCQHPMEVQDPYRFNLSPKQRKLFEFILAHGINGANNRTIMSKLAIESYTTLRTRIHSINKRIAPMEITACGGGYRIERANQ